MIWNCNVCITCHIMNEFSMNCKIVINLIMLKIFYICLPETQLDRVIFEQWEEDNTLFVRTKACEKVKSKIENQNVVVVTGHSGCGKSAVIQHIALEYRNSGWIVKPVVDVKEMMQIIRTLESGLLSKTRPFLF